MAGEPFNRRHGPCGDLGFAYRFEFNLGDASVVDVGY